MVKDFNLKLLHFSDRFIARQQSNEGTHEFDGTIRTSGHLT